MMVSELIAQLERMPPGLDVLIVDQSGYAEELNRLSVEQRTTDSMHDSAEPHNEYKDYQNYVIIR